MVTNRQHEPVRLEYFDRSVLVLLDGTRDRAQLVEVLTQLAVNGQLAIWKDTQRVQNATLMPAILVESLRESLTRLARFALLVA